MTWEAWITATVVALMLWSLARGLPGYGPWAVLAGVYALTTLFTELVTNNAAAALAFPIAYAAAGSLGVCGR